jgi:VWFA-related protein
MKTFFPLAVILFLCVPSYAQQSFVEQSLVLNVEVPARVFLSGRFVDTLALDDFEILEDGIPQRIEACYLVRKSTIERREEKRRYLPETGRHFYLFFEITEYDPRLDEALDYFFQNILVPSDNLVVITPIKTYRLKDQAFQAKPQKAISDELRGIIRKDCVEGNSEFRNTVSDLTALAKSLSGQLQAGAEDGAPAKEQDGSSKSEFQHMRIDEQLILYSTLLDKLDSLREVSQMKLLDFAHHLVRQEGQKYVFLFYQREYIPQIAPRILGDYISLYQENYYVYQTLNRAAGFRDREATFDTEKVKQAYADASTAVHFMFMTTPRPEVAGVYMHERSEDMFNSFRQMAEATGGIFQSSANPAAMFRSALEAAENYYLLYYTPKRLEEGERNFRTIDVRVKKGQYQVLHRSGYFLN